MDLTSFFHWLQDGAVATAIREGETLFPWIESVHVLAVTFVVGSIAAVDLRLLGLAARLRAVSRVEAEIVPLTWIAFAVTVVSGGLLFSSKAVQYAGNLSFQLKIGLLLLAGINMAVFQLVTCRSIDGWDKAAMPPAAVRLAGGLSLLLWIAIIACGRTIGFTMVEITD
jgi:hypothetical protein